MGEPKERPILMNGAMVRAVLAGRKTVTRRLVKPQTSIEGQVPHLASCPYGVAGDRLWVRETFDHIAHGPGFGVRLRYADGDERGWQEAPHPSVRPDENGWRPLDWRRRPSIHMPRWASRIDLEITDVRVERLQEITDEDARAEGVEHVGTRLSPNTCLSAEQTMTTGEKLLAEPYRGAFAWLWDELYADTATWKSNPWVWRVAFRRVERAARAA